MKAWITKYALTQGIFEVEGDASKEYPDMLCQTFPKSNYGGITYHGRGRDWHETEDGAKAQAKKMRDKKVASMLKQIKKLQAMTF